MYEYLDEDENSFKLKDKSGKEMMIAKKQLGDALAEKIRGMKPLKMAKGGEVPDYLSTDYQARPDLLAQAVSSPIEQYSGQPGFQPQNFMESLEYGVGKAAMPLVAPFTTGTGQAGYEAYDKALSDKITSSRGGPAQAQPQAQTEQPKGYQVAGNGMIPADAVPIGGERASQGIAGGQVTGPVAQPQGMGELDKIAKQMKGAAEMQSKAQQDLANDQIKIQQQSMDALKGADAAYNQKIADLDLQQKEIHDSIMTQKIDPNRVWNNASTGSKISAGIGMILGGLGSGLTGQPNAAVAMLDKIVSRDIDAQKSELGKKQTLFSQNVQKYQNMNQAYTATKLQLGAQVQAQLQMAAARAATPMAKAQALQASAAIDAQMMPLKQGLAKQVADQQLINYARAGGDTPEVIQQLPVEVRERWVPGFGAATTKESAKLANEKVSNIKGITQSLDELISLADRGSSLSPSDRARAQTLAGLLKGKLRVEVVGPGAVSESEGKLMDSIISNPMNITQLASTAKTSLGTVKSKVNKNLGNDLMQYGLRPQKQLDFGKAVQGKK